MWRIARAKVVFMTRTCLPTLSLGAAMASLSCAAGSNPSSGGPVQDTGTDGGFAVDVGGSDGGLNVDTAPTEGGDGTSVVYAHTDDSLYAMDPATKGVSLIGKFVGASSGLTDCAVDRDGHLFVNSTSVVYTAALPAGGTGDVALSVNTTLPSDSKFYALGFTPAGVLEAGETLIAGDGAGDLYWIDTSSSSATPVKLGVFGAWMPGDPGPGRSGDTWALSGDVLFYMDGSTPRGIATLRSCYSSSGGSPKCQTTNDVFAEIDMAALKTAFDTRSPQNVRKRIIGGGSHVGQLYGLGAWDDESYAFSRGPAQLVQIDGAGTGTVINDFPSITNGWSGACVTTKAKISVIK
jgi:hypothetical protein